MLNKALRDKLIQLGKYPEIKWIKLFGSRAKGTAKEKSDYDLAIKYGKKLKGFRQQEIEDFIRAADLFGKDIINYDGASNNIKHHIDGYGAIIYIDRTWFLSWLKMEGAYLNFEKFLKKKIEDKEVKRMTVILSFIFLMELMWKFFKDHLEDMEAVVVKSPRESFEQAFQVGWIEDARQWSKMLSDRNDAVHSYNEDKAIQLYNNINSYYPEIKKSFKKLEKMVKIEAEAYAGE